MSETVTGSTCFVCREEIPENEQFCWDHAYKSPSTLLRSRLWELAWRWQDNPDGVIQNCGKQLEDALDQGA